MAASMLPLVLAATAAAAAAVPIDAPPPSPDMDAPSKLRSGIVLGLTLGGGVGSASGYPNSASEIGDPNFHSASGWMTGASDTLLVMGAIADYLNFGFWFGSTSFSNSDWRATGGGLGLRVEAFPLLRLYPRLSGLGVLGNFGIGIGKLTSTHPGELGASGTQSFLGTGVFYEWSFGHALGGHFGAGPALEYDAIWSRPYESHGLVASARIVFYGGP
jgi:hypothetical protein